MHAIDYAKQAGSLFVLPDTVMRLRQLGSDDTASMADIAEVINYDPALSAQLLKIANSAMYNFEQEVDTTAKAIQVIGFDAVYDLALAYAVANAFGRVNSKVIDVDKYWQLSVCCALVAKHIASKLACPQAERLFVTGLLHNIGELVMVQLAPALARRCTPTASQYTPLALQQQHLGFSYADVSAQLLQLWHVPKEIFTTIQHQHCSQYQAVNMDERIIQLARLVALDNAHIDLYPGSPHLQPQAYESLGLTKSHVDYALDNANLQSISVLALFNPAAFAIY